MHNSSKDWPQFSQDSEQRRFSTTVRSGDHQVHSWGNLEAHVWDKNVSVGGEDGHVLEDDVAAEDDAAQVLHGVVLQLGLLDLRSLSLNSVWRHVLELLQFLLLLDLDSLVLVLLKVIQHLLHLVDQGCVACQRLHFLVRHYDSSNGLSQVDKEGRVPDVVFGDLRSVGADFLQVLLLVGAEHGKSQDSVSHHDGSVLDKHGVVDSHEESLQENSVNVLSEDRELVINLSFLPRASIIKSDFLGVIEQVRMFGSVVSLELLLLGGELSEGRGDEANDDSRHKVPSNGQSRSFPSNELRKLSREEEDVENWLGNVEIEVGETHCPLVQVLRQPLVRVLDSAVQVANPDILG